MTQAPPFDPTMFSGNGDVSPQPATVAWEALNANDYSTTLEALAEWLQWLVPTYRIPPSVIPPCWFLHAGLIEELGHLWIGWQVTRHPESGVGMVGLDWNNHRERTIARSRELVGVSGCNGTSHSIKSEPRLNQNEHSWGQHLESETEDRNNRSVRAGVTAAGTDALMSSENLELRASRALTAIAADPSHPTTQEVADAVSALNSETGGAIQLAVRQAENARRNVEHALKSVEARATLHRARGAIVASILDSGDRCSVALSEDWLKALAAVAPAEFAIRRSAAVNTATTART